MTGTYPFYHTYTKPADYVICSTATRNNFVFDGDRVGTSTRIRFSYDGGPILESFGRTTGTVLGSKTPDVGPWSSFDPQAQRGIWNSTTWAVTGGQGYSTDPTGANILCVIDTRNTDHDVSVTVSATAGNAGLDVRSSGGNPNPGYVSVYLDIAAARVKAATPTVIWTGSTVVTAGAHVLRVVVVGDNYTVYLDGVQEGTFSTSVANAFTSMGLYTTSSTARFSAFSAVKNTNPVATTYTVRNYDGDIVASGSVTDDHIDIADSALTWRGRGPYGWYRVYLTGPDHGDSQWGTAYGDCSFYRIRTDSGFAANSPNKYTAALATNVDEYSRITVGGAAAFPRFEMSMTSSANNAHIVTAAPIMKTNWVDLAPSLRPRVNLGAFGNGATVGIESTVITPTVALLKDSIKLWEPRNEPYYTPGQGGGESYITSEFDAFRTAVKAGDATARVAGPGPVTFDHSDAGAVLSFVSTFLAGCMSRGGTAYLDALSVHSYNCTNGDLALARRSLVGLKAVVTANGYTGPIYQTEQGFDWEHYGVSQPRHGGQWTALDVFMDELYGVPFENYSYFYDISHGFDDIPMWWMSSTGPGPQVLPLRVMQAEIGNRTLTAQFDFDVYSQYVYAGGTWTGGDGSKTVGFVAASTGLRDLALTVTGSPSTLTCVDCWGNTYTVAVSAGTATLPVGEMPVWVRCPVGVTVAPTAIGFVTNLATSATATSTGDSTAINRVNDGVMQNQYYNSTSVWTDSEAPYSERSNTFPQTVTLTWPSPVTANRIVVHSMAPWQELGTLTDFDVDTWDGSSWTTRYSQALPTSKTFLFTGIGRCLVEQFWDGRHVWDVAFTAGSISKVRVVVRACSYGEFETSYIRTNIYGGALTQYLAIREIEVFNATQSLSPRSRNPGMGGTI